MPLAHKHELPRKETALEAANAALAKFARERAFDRTRRCLDGKIAAAQKELTDLGPLPNIADPTSAKILRIVAVSSTRSGQRRRRVSEWLSISGLSASNFLPSWARKASGWFRFARHEKKSAGQTQLRFLSRAWRLPDRLARRARPYRNWSRPPTLRRRFQKPKLRVGRDGEAAREEEVRRQSGTKSGKPA